jgi:glycosyltransferase involved in cell wall biosynthesis
VDQISLSIIIPTFNGGKRIGACLKSLLAQTVQRAAEIIVVDDGSTDDTAAAVARFSDVRLITQQNAGPAAARNHGAREASGAIIIFTDDDCEPAPGWLDAMVEPFADPEIVGVQGCYRTHQRALSARFVQLECEERYRIMRHSAYIDFIGSYSAGYRREYFLAMKGFDSAFPVACAEDAELAYRMAEQGWKMKFAPEAVIYHQHPDSFAVYFKKKFKFAFWRVLAVRKNPRRGVKDTYTPQLMKLQLLFWPALLGGLIADVCFRNSMHFGLIALLAFLVTTAPFFFNAMIKDPLVGILSPGIIAFRSCVQLLGVIGGIVGARVKAGAEAK